MIIYANGDSFVAGVELGDNIISNHPGFLPYRASDSQLEKNAQWIANTYKQNHPYAVERLNKANEISSLERERAFPNKIGKILACDVINHAQGGSSLDRIARTTIVDLLELKEKHSNIVAIISTTCPSRSEICSPFANKETDNTGFSNTWEQVSTTYKSDHQTGKLGDFINYKIEFEKNYHQLVNAYKNILSIKNLCKLFDIRLYWIAGHIDIKNQVPVEYELKDIKDLKILQHHAEFNYTIDMTLIASNCEFDEVLCPSRHYSEKVHEVVAERLSGIINASR